MAQATALINGNLTVFASNTPAELMHQDVYKMFPQGYYWQDLKHFVALFLETGKVMETLSKCKLWLLGQELI